MEKKWIWIIIILVAIIVAGFLLKDKITGKTIAKPNSLVAYYDFEGDVKDSSGNGNHGASYNLNDSNYIEGADGLGLHLNGMDDYVEISDTSFNLVTDTDFTISLWVKPECVGGTNRIIDKTKAKDGTGFALWASQENIYITLKDSDYDEVESFTSFNCLSKKWNFVVAVADRDGNLKMYKDGKLQDSQSLTKSSNKIDNINNNVPLAIGKSIDANAEYFEGLIDEIKIWNYALTKEQIVEEYNSVI